MKRVLFALSLLVLSSVPLLSQDNPFVVLGNLILQNRNSNPDPHQESDEDGCSASDGAKYTFDGVAADGTPFSYSFTVKYDGKDYPVTGTGMPAGAGHHRH